MFNQDQVCQNLLLVKPAFFGWNNETAESNAFQKREETFIEIINENAQYEFSSLCLNLTDAGINYTVFENAELNSPDSIFPNNWISTHHNGSVILYPMLSEKRRRERNPAVIDMLKSKFMIAQILDLSFYEKENKFLEGTGSIVFDHKNRIAYASVSIRTNEVVLKEVCKSLEYNYFIFNSFDKNGTAVYHTNVIMNIGETYAVVCSEVVKNASERKKLLNSLKDSGRDIIEIDYKQMESFAGNMLQVKNRDQELITLLSTTAFDSLSDSQIAHLIEHTHLLRIAMPQIEKTGGGSVRCMIAENFLQKKN